MLFNRFASWIFTTFDFPFYKAFLFYLGIALFYLCFIYFYILIFGKKTKKKFVKDIVGIVWPFIVLSPTILLLLTTIHSDFLMKNNFAKIGINYLSFFGIQPAIINLLLIIIFCSSMFYLTTSRKRISKNHKKTTWITKVKGLLWVNGLFEFIVCFFLILSGVIILYQWINLLHFFNSNWIPSSEISQEILFNLSWIKEIIISELLLLTILSITPLIISIRERKFGSTKIYTYGFMVAFTAIVLFSLLLIVSYNNFLDNLKTTLLSKITNDINKFQTNDMQINDQLERIYLSLKLQLTYDTPNSLDIPKWLEGILGIRLIVFLAELINISSSPKWKLLDKVIKIVKG